MTRTAAFGLNILALGAASFALAATAAAQAQTPPSGRVYQVGDRWVCRRPDADHPQNATSSDNVALSCRPINAGIPMSNGGMMVIGTVQARPANAANQPAMLLAPALSAGLTPAQLNDQWQTFVRQTLQIPDAPPGGG
jgi:hypothetical protein